MADNTKIEWTDSTWQPITGCSVVSPGCTNCYAMKLAGTRLKHHPSRIGLTDISKAGPVWNGQVRFNEQWLDQPLRWRKPRKIFVCAHGDLFHENVPDEWIDRVFAVMTLAPQHTFQVLTKRPERMLAYCGSDNTIGRVATLIAKIIHGIDGASASVSYKEDGLSGILLPNAWLGVSVENQETANERIPLLLQTPAAIRFLSCEPLLGNVDIARWLDPLGIECMDICSDKSYINMESAETWTDNRGDVHPLCPDCGEVAGWTGYDPGIDWVIVGGESGPGARPMHPDWDRSLRDQCAETGVPFFFKQHGEWCPATREFGVEGSCMPETGEKFTWIGWDGKTQNPSSHGLTEPIMAIARQGKKAAGSLLDGEEYKEFPVTL